MAITPNSTIYLLNNVPLDKSYDHTIYFTDVSTQAAYFRAKAIYSLTSYTYQRAGSGIIKVQIPAERLYTVNYMMFQNTGYGWTDGNNTQHAAKWFYAFVTEIEYINDETSAIHYEIDDLQTWMMDFSLDYCFVERNHTPDDIIGHYIEPEPVSPGEYVCNGAYVPLNPTNVALNDLGVILAVCELDDNYDGGHKYDGIFGAARLTYFSVSSESLTKLNQVLASYTNKPSAISAIYCVPKALIPANRREAVWASLDNTAAPSYTVSAATLTGSETLDGYTPKNKKLYTYPYNFYNVDNSNGGTLALRYEFFDNIGNTFTPMFKIAGGLTQPVRVVLRPYAYKNMHGSGGVEDPTTNNMETLSLENYPLCSWAIDSYNAWVAQNAVPEAIKAGASGASIGAGLAASILAAPAAAPLAIGAAAVSGIALVGSALTKMYNASIQADITAGNFNNGSINCAIGTQNFYGGRFSITAERARCIDDFFSRYGYAMNRLMIPWRDIREQWTYVKTIGCTLTGSVPADAAAHLCAIHDAGITYWRVPANIGNYGLSNNPRQLPG